MSKQITGLPTIKDLYDNRSRIQSPMAVDTETSGLFVDAGARVSTVSGAFYDLTGWWEETYGTGQVETAGGVFTIKRELIEVPDNKTPHVVVSFAYPVDQGIEGTGKPEDTGLSALWVTTSNITPEEYDLLVQVICEVGDRCGLIFHHAKFDLHIFGAGLRGDQTKRSAVDLSPYLLWDTQNVTDLFWSRTGTTSLKPTAARLWGEDQRDEQRIVKEYLRAKNLPQGRWDLMPWDVIGRYADQDARLTLRLWALQNVLIETNRLPCGNAFTGGGRRLTIEQAIQRRLDTSVFLFNMERRGLPFNTELSLKTADEIDRRIDALVSNFPIPITVKNLSNYWFTTKEVAPGVTGLGLDPVKVSDKGTPSVDKEVVSELVDRKVPLAAEYAQITALRNANSRWYRGWAERAGVDGRLRTSVRQNGTVSGRFSVEHVQLQAIPHDYRLGSVFEGLTTPRKLIQSGIPDGYELWELDLMQAELRVAALFADCKRMRELVESGEDLHGDTATELFGVTPDDPGWSELRTVAKRSNFSLIFGVGGQTLKDALKAHAGVDMSLQDATELVAKWNDLYPEYRRAIRVESDNVVRRYRKTGVGWVQTANGERRWFTARDIEMHNGRDSVHKAFNQKVQSSLAQFATDMWLDTDEYIGETVDDPNAGIVLVVHDSMDLLLPKGSKAVVENVKDRVVDLWGHWFPGIPGGLDGDLWG